MNRYSFYIHVFARLEQYKSGSESGSKKKTRPELSFLTGFALAPESSIPVAGSNVKIGVFISENNQDKDN